MYFSMLQFDKILWVECQYRVWYKIWYFSHHVLQILSSQLFSPKITTWWRRHGWWTNERKTIFQGQLSLDSKMKPNTLHIFDLRIKSSLRILNLPLECGITADEFTMWILQKILSSKEKSNMFTKSIRNQNKQNYHYLSAFASGNTQNFCLLKQVQI